MVGSESTSTLQKPDSEADAYAFLERLRWGGDGPTQCPHCSSGKGAWYLKPKNPEGRKSKGGSTARSQRRVWKCRENSCRRQFSVLTNTVMHATKMPVRAWVGTIIDLCEDADGVSARDIVDRWSVTEKSAWAMLTRIQDALTEPEIAGARLASNAPLWFELAADDAISVAGQKRELEELAERLELEEQEAKRQVAEQIQRDVERALAPVDVPDSPPEAPPQAGTQTTGTEPPAQMTSTSHDAANAFEPLVDIDVDAIEEPARGERRSMSDSDSQVQSDVQRVLAEVFGDGVPVPKATRFAAVDAPLHTLAPGQGQLQGIASGPAPELGPTWSLSAADLANNQQCVDVPDDQLGLFADGVVEEHHTHRS